jgi:hypothetical protein
MHFLPHMYRKAAFSIHIVVRVAPAVEETAISAIATIEAIKTALFEAKHRIRAGYKFYSRT